MRQPLTETESKVYQYLIDFLSAHTYQPSVREIGREFGIKSTKTVSELLQSLADKGYIERDPARSRGVRLLGYSSTRAVAPVPFCGQVAAGEPIALRERPEGAITLDRRFVPSDDAYFVQVSGHSMAGRGILDDDYVLVEPGVQPEEGDVVLASVNGGGAVKLYSRREDGRVVLRAAGDERETIAEGPGTEIRVLGVASAVFRPLRQRPVERRVERLVDRSGDRAEERVAPPAAADRLEQLPAPVT